MMKWIGLVIQRLQSIHIPLIGVATLGCVGGGLGFLVATASMLGNAGARGEAPDLPQYVALGTLMGLLVGVVAEIIIAIAYEIYRRTLGRLHRPRVRLWMLLVVVAVVALISLVERWLYGIAWYHAGGNWDGLTPSEARAFLVFLNVAMILMIVFTAPIVYGTCVLVRESRSRWRSSKVSPDPREPN
jgi:uncharacterized membrane protein